MTRGLPTGRQASSNGDREGYNSTVSRMSWK